MDDREIDQQEIERQIRRDEDLNYVPAGTQYLACTRCLTVRPLLPHLALGGGVAAGDQCRIPFGPDLPAGCDGRLAEVVR